MAKHEEHPFYGKPIYRDRQAHYIKELLSKYKGEKATEELKKRIWDDLQMAKHEGKVSIPFKVALRLDPTGMFPEYVEVLLDTKV